MHEYSIVQSLLDSVDKEARSRGALAVHRLEVSIGELAGVEKDLLAIAFETFRPRTLCENAELRMTMVPARWECRRCESEVCRGARLQCSACGRPADLVAGGEITLDRIELEVDHV